jgi:hypothetical protein
VRDKDRLFIGKCYLEMFRSLCKAVNEAGGTTPTLEDMNEMSAWDFFNRYATNGVRFYHDKEALRNDGRP